MRFPIPYSLYASIAGIGGRLSSRVYSPFALLN
jgi:hypothetical protein